MPSLENDGNLIVYSLLLMQKLGRNHIVSNVSQTESYFINEEPVPELNANLNKVAEIERCLEQILVWAAMFAAACIRGLLSSCVNAMVLLTV